MADDVKVAPTPIQRNELDVATELTELYFKYHNPKTIEEIQTTFVKMYAAASAAENGGFRENHYLASFLPEELRNKAGNPLDMDVTPRNRTQ